MKALIYNSGHEVVKESLSLITLFVVSHSIHWNFDLTLSSFPNLCITSHHTHTYIYIKKKKATTNQVKWYIY